MLKLVGRIQEPFKKNDTNDLNQNHLISLPGHKASGDWPSWQTDTSGSWRRPEGQQK